MIAALGVVGSAFAFLFDIDPFAGVLSTYDVTAPLVSIVTCPSRRVCSFPKRGFFSFVDLCTDSCLDALKHRHWDHVDKRGAYEVVAMVTLDWGGVLEFCLVAAWVQCCGMG